MGINSANNTYPPYTEILQDSTGIEKDTNGVVVSVPNYDIGLPASGLLIWHIDNSIISSSIGSYGINNDVHSMGVDLEEADGAQDIGHPSIFLFNDPSSGYFGDMWFNGNTQFTLANPSLEGLKPEFGPYTYPSTEANNGSKTFVKFDTDTTPSFLDGKTQYSHSEILAILETDEWTDPNFPPGE